MNDESQPPVPRLGEIGLTHFAPYLMNRSMGRYNASLRDEMAAMGLTTPKMRALAVLSVVEGPLIRELAVYTVTEQSTLSRALDALEREGLVRREADPVDGDAVPKGQGPGVGAHPHTSRAPLQPADGLHQSGEHG